MIGSVSSSVKWLAISAIVAGALGSAWGVVRYIEHKALLVAQNKALIEAAKYRHDRKVIDDELQTLERERLIECVAGRIECCRRETKCEIRP